MKALIIIAALLIPICGIGQQTDGGFKWNVRDSTGYEIGTPGIIWQSFGDTIPATIIVQYTRRDALTTREVYLINGEPWYRSTAAFTKGKWIKPKWYRWKIW